MAVTRSLANGNKVVDWTEEVNEIDNQYGLVNALGLFQGEGISTETVLFDKNTQTTTLLPQVSRRGGEHSKGKDRKVETFALPTSYFSHQDYVTPQDVQGYRMAGTPQAAETLANVIATKLEDLRMSADQTREYMKIQAMKGITKTPDGAVLANMFTEFGVNAANTDPNAGAVTRINFDLANSASDIDGHIALLKRQIARNAKVGGAIGRIEVLVSPDFFDALVSHPKVEEAYKYYQNSNKQILRDDLSMYESWGVVDMFEHKGILFVSYDAEFVLPNGTTEPALVSGEGYTYVKGMRNLYRSYYAPANTLSGSNTVGTEMFAYQYRDPKDKFEELEIEMAPLDILTKPQVSIQVVSGAAVASR